MGFALLKKKAHSLQAEACWLVHIKNDEEYEMALALMAELIEDYDHNLLLIEILSASIERWENESKSFALFNQMIEGLDQGLSVLKVLMNQYHLGVSNFPEIGSKSLVSKIVNGHRQLTLEHINALSKRFGINPALFFAFNQKI